MSPPPTAEDLGWWRELLAWVGSGVVAVASGTWIVASHKREIQDRQKALEEAQGLQAARLTDLEAQRADMGRYCKEQRREILEDLRREICAILTNALKDAKIEAADARASVTTSLALHTMALQNIEADIKAIFGRLDRRHEKKFVPLGRREEDLES